MDMARFIQICASQNDLFTLDEDGNVYQYNFNTKRWVKLVMNEPDQPDAADRRARQDRA
jgi:hypothetical protein